MRITHLPEGEARCELYSVTLNGKAADVAAARVSAINYNCEWPGHQRPLDQTEISGFVTCCSNAAVEVAVRVNGPITDPVVRPLSKKIDVAIEGDTARFTLPGPGQYSFEPCDWHCALQLFVSEEYAEPQTAGRVLRYAPGVHHVGLVELKSNDTLIIEDGAVVYGSFCAFYKQNITVTGGGILDGSEEKRVSGQWLLPCAQVLPDGSESADYLCDEAALRRFIKEAPVLNGLLRFYACKNVTVEHITCRDSSTFNIIPAGCEKVTFDDVRIVGSWRYNADGIDLFNCSNVIIRNSYLRDFDDCVVIKGYAGWDNMNNENIITENCVIWCDWGRALEIGAETNAKEYRNIIFRNCDVIHGSWLQLDIQHHNNADIHDILFENIRCEFSKYQSGMKMGNCDKLKYEDAELISAQPGLLGAFFFDMGLFGHGHGTEKIHNITFRDIQVLCDEEIPMPTCQFIGLNEEARVDGVVLENITRNGVWLDTAEKLNLTCNEFARNVVIK